MEEGDAIQRETHCTAHASARYTVQPTDHRSHSWTKVNAELGIDGALADMCAARGVVVVSPGAGVSKARSLIFNLRPYPPTPKIFGHHFADIL